MANALRKDFFISYSKADKHWAEWIAWQLEAVGYSTHLQAWDFRPGGNFVHEMQAGLMRCARTIATLSKTYTQSGFTEAEWSAAFAQDPCGNKGLLLPVRVENCEVKGLLGQVIYLDLVGLDETAAKECLLEGVKPGRRKPAQAPHFPMVRKPVVRKPLVRKPVLRKPVAIKPLFPALDTSNPYRGLAPFDAQHRAAFHGRERYVTAACAKLEEKRLACIVGASGSGKSSLARAGVLPALEDKKWLTACCRPRQDPFRELAYGLMPFLEPNLTEPGPIWHAAERYADGFRDGPGNLASLLTFVIEHCQAPGLMILVDQFEELFSQVPETHRASFIDLLCKGWGNCQAPVKWLLTLRADFMEQAVQFDPLRAMLQDATVLLGPMNQQELRAAIVEPAAILDVRFEAGLPERLVQDTTHTKPPIAPEEAELLSGRLPLLAFALSELWMRQKGGVIPHAVYDDPDTGIGGIEGALREHAERVYGQYEADRQAQMRQLFRRLIAHGPGLTGVRRLVPRDEVTSMWDDLIADLAKQRLVTTSESASGQATVEVTHEALLRAWPDLRNWVSENREFDQWRQGISEQAANWNQASASAKADLLLRGTLLDKALVNRRERAEELTPVETNFIEASLRAAEQQKEASLAAKRERKQALAHKLAAEAARLAKWGSGNALFRAAALAVESWNRLPNADAHAVAVTLLKRRPLSRHPVLPRFNHVHDQFALSADARYMAVAQAMDGVHLIELASGAEQVYLRPKKGEFTRMRCLAFSPDSGILVAFRSVASTTNSAQLNIIRTATGKTLLSTSAHPDFSALTISANSRYLAFQSDSTVHVIDLDSGRPIFQIENSSRINTLLFSPDGTTLAIFTYDTDAPHLLIDVPSGHERTRIEATNSLFNTAFSNNGKSLLWISCEDSGDNNLTLWIVDTVTGAKTATVPLCPRSYMISAEAAGVVAICEDNKRVRLIALPGGVELHRFEDSAEVGLIKLYDDGRKLLVWRKPSSIDIIDTRSGQALRHIDFGADIQQIHVAPHGAYFIVIGKNGVTANNWGGAGLLLSLFEPVKSIVGLTPNGELMITSVPTNEISANTREANRVRFYETYSGCELTIAEIEGLPKIKENPGFSDNGRFPVMPYPSPSTDLLVADCRNVGGSVWIEQAQARSLEFSPDAANVAIVRHDNQVIIVTADTRQSLLVIPPGYDVSGVAFSPDGKLLTAWGKDNVRLFEIASGTQRADIPVTGHVREVKFSTDSRVLASTSEDGRVRIIDTGSGSVISNINLESEWPIIEFHPNSQLLAAIAQKEEDHTCRVIDVLTGAEHFKIELDAKLISIAFSPDGLTLAVETLNNVTRLIDVSSGAERIRLIHQFGPGWTIGVSPIFAPDSQTIALVFRSNQIQIAWIFDPENGNERARVDASTVISARSRHESIYIPLEYDHATAFSSNGHHFAIGSVEGGLAYLLETSTGHEILRMKLGDEGYVGVEFSPDGRYLAAASRNGAVRLASIAEKREIGQQHSAGVMTLQFSPDSRTLATASEDGTVQFMNTDDGRVVARFEHGAPVNHIAFSPDGRWLATHSKGTARLFRADPGWYIEQLCARTGANLSRSEWANVIGPDEPWRPTCPHWHTPDAASDITE